MPNNRATNDARPPAPAASPKPVIKATIHPSVTPLRIESILSEGRGYHKTLSCAFPENRLHCVQFEVCNGHMLFLSLVVMMAWSETGIISINTSRIPL